MLPSWLIWYFAVGAVAVAAVVGATVVVAAVFGALGAVATTSGTDAAPRFAPWPVTPANRAANNDG